MIYCIREQFGKKQIVTEDEFWRLVFSECVFGGQGDVDVMEHNLHDGMKYIGTTHMFWCEDES